MNAIDLVAVASRVGLAVIFNTLWQGALIAGVAWVTLRIFSRANATTRYAVWSLTLLAMLIEQRIGVFAAADRFGEQRLEARIDRNNRE